MVSENMRSQFVIIVAVLLVSCASNSGVVEIGDGELFIAKQAATGFPGTGKIKTEALQEATAHCSSQGKSLNVLKLHENEGPFVLGKYPRVELNFECK